MAASVHLQGTLSALSAALQVGLLTFLLFRKYYRSFPAFCAYLAINLLQGGLFFVVFSRYGFHSQIARASAWISQGVVVMARGISVVEMCRHILARYRGIWGLGWRVMAIGASGVFAIAITLGRHDLRAAVLTLDLGIELAIATGIVVLFVFAKHYELTIDEPLRSLGLGFWLYSCVYVINDLLLQRLLYGYAEIWNLVDAVAFIASVALWLRAFLRPALAPASQPVMLDASVYSKLMPEVNRRLLLLNEQLSRIWKAETRHT